MSKEVWKYVLAKHSVFPNDINLEYNPILTRVSFMKTEFEICCWNYIFDSFQEVAQHKILFLAGDDVIITFCSI